jgi:methionyl aminopeptidase
MLYYKTNEEIELIRESSLLVAKALAEVAKVIRPGVTTIELDKVAETFIRDHQGVPAFLNYNGFPNSLCISVNAQVVHGIPGQTELKDGDICSVDCGVVKNGFYGDSAYTFSIGEVADETLFLLKSTKESLYKGIEKAVAGNRLGDVSAAVQEHAEKTGTRRKEWFFCCKGTGRTWNRKASSRKTGSSELRETGIGNGAEGRIGHCD